MTSPIPDPALILLVGPSGSGKSTWAGVHYRSEEIVSSDELRARVGSGPTDLDASGDAFEILELVASRRIGRRLTTVVDTLGYDRDLRTRLAALAARHGLATVAVVMDTAPVICRERNRARPRPVPVRVLDGQFRRLRDVRRELEEEGWTVRTAEGGSAPVSRPTPYPPPSESVGSRLAFHLHIARFPGEGIAAHVTEAARMAEAAGFTGLSVMDHLVQIPQVGREWDPLPEAIALLAHLGAVTTRLRLTVLVTPVTFRHPMVLGRQLATIDVMTGGRITCGLGAGWFPAEHDALGIAFPATHHRLDMLEDAAQLLPLLWGPGAPEFRGRTIHVPRAIGYPRPVQDRIPILVGGGGERRTLRIAAAYADGWNVRAGIDTFRRKQAVVARHCEELGRDPAGLRATILDPVVYGADRSEVAEIVETERGRTEAALFAERHHAGVTDAQVRRYADLAAAGVDEIFVTPVDSDLHRAIDRFAPIMAALV